MKVEAAGSKPHVVTRETATNVHFRLGGSPVPGPLSTHEPFLCSCTWRNEFLNSNTGLVTGECEDSKT